VSQEDADAEEHSQRDYDLGHRRAHWLAVPGTTALRNCRWIVLRMSASMIEPLSRLSIRLERIGFRATSRAIEKNGFVAHKSQKPALGGAGFP
jgi:hypothetical protein